MPFIKNLGLEVLRQTVKNPRAWLEERYKGGEFDYVRITKHSEKVYSVSAGIWGGEKVRRVYVFDETVRIFKFKDAEQWKKRKKVIETFK